MFKDLKLRVFSGIALFTSFIIIVFIFPVLIKPLIFILAFIMLRELYLLSGVAKPGDFAYIIIGMVNTFPLVFSQSSPSLALLIAIPLALVTIFFNRSIFIGLGQLYIVGSLILLLDLIVSDPPVGGLNFFVFFVVCVALSDIGGYFGGQIIGGKKVFERVSPNKTWAGVIVGWLLAGIFYYFLFFIGFFESYLYLFLFLGIALSSQIGDFIESYTKRYFDVKDSGQIIPGHGGALDRFDGMIFSIYFVKVFDLTF